jgi:hypothetical protein
MHLLALALFALTGALALAAARFVVVHFVILAFALAGLLGVALLHAAVLALLHAALALLAAFVLILAALLTALLVCHLGFLLIDKPNACDGETAIFPGCSARYAVGITTLNRC